MAVLSAKLRKGDGNRILWWCPGCKEAHQINVGEGSLRWSWDGNVDLPTFSPSILVKGVRNNLTDAEWEDFDRMDVKADREKILADRRFASVCHCFVRNGQIQFLSDCTHELRGKTVPLPDFKS